MEKQQVIDAFNKDREFFMNRIAEFAATTEVECNAKAVTSSIMKLIVSDQYLSDFRSQLLYDEDDRATVTEMVDTAIGELMEVLSPKMTRKVDAELKRMDKREDMRVKMYGKR